MFACFEALKIFRKKIFFFHASEIENLTYIDWWVMRWARRAKQKGCDRWERWEWNIDHHGKSLYIFSLYWLTGIHNSRYTPTIQCRWNFANWKWNGNSFNPYINQMRRLRVKNLGWLRNDGKKKLIKKIGSTMLCVSSSDNRKAFNKRLEGVDACWGLLIFRFNIHWCWWRRKWRPQKHTYHF